MLASTSFLECVLHVGFFAIAMWLFAVVEPWSNRLLRLLGRGIMHLFDRRSATDETSRSAEEDAPYQRKLSSYGQDGRLLLVACAAKFAKTDGVVTKSELAVVEKFFGYLDLTGKLRQQAIATFNQAKAGRASLEATLRFCVAQRWWQSPWPINALLMFFKLAYADGQPNARTQQTLEAICGWLKEDYQECRREYEAGRREAAAHQPDGLEAAYVILGCQPDDALDVIKDRYRKLVKDFHADTVCRRVCQPTSSGSPRNALSKSRRHTKR